MRTACLGLRRFKKAGVRGSKIEIEELVASFRPRASNGRLSTKRDMKMIG